MTTRPAAGPGVTVRTVRRSDLPALEALRFSAGLATKHHDRVSRQEAGEAGYLIAVRECTIAGHLFLKCDGPGHPSVRALAPPCAEVEDFVVDPSLRRQGIGTALLDAAAAACREHGIRHLGLSVGIANHDARRLYTRWGMAPVPGSAHRVTWRTVNAEGREAEAYEDCTYLLKELA